MIPLLDKASKTNSSDTNKRKCVNILWFLLATSIFTIVIAITIYFGTTSSLQNNNPARNLYFNHKINDVTQSDPSLSSEYYKSNGYDDVIASLPNLNLDSCSSSATNCEFNQYSGYLLANDNREIHYWFIQADTIDDSSSKPLFFWTNGGPGCSGMDGLLTEQGPWRVLDDLTIEYNQYSWINEVNMIFLEQPYGVGFSTASATDVVSGDQNAADDMDAIIRNFLIKFPAYINNDIYLSSESWGGHYVPITTYTILQNNDNGYEPYINFRGFLLGNPYTDFYENTYGFIGGIYGHGLMKNSDWEDWQESCWDNSHNVDTLDLCSAIYVRAYMSAWNANVYALDWPQCILDESWSTSESADRISLNNNDPLSEYWLKDNHFHFGAKRFLNKVLNHKNYESLNMGINKDSLQAVYDKISMKDPTKKIKMSNNNNIIHKNDEYDVTDSTYLPCSEHNMETYLNIDDVQTALNVKPTTWTMCSNQVWNVWPESDYDTFVESYYTEIIDHYSSELNLKLTIYSGDDDSVCGIQGTMYWLDRWEYQENADLAWIPWEDDDEELGGYYTQYLDINNNIALHFISIRTAGHMVPTTQPGRALTVLRKYLYEFDTS